MALKLILLFSCENASGTASFINVWTYVGDLLLSDPGLRWAVALEIIITNSNINVFNTIVCACDLFIFVFFYFFPLNNSYTKCG